MKRPQFLDPDFIQEVLDKNPNPGILKNPDPLISWPYILQRHGDKWEFDQEQASFQPFNLLGVAILFTRMWFHFWGLFIACGILVLLFQLLSLFGLVAPLW